ncbi:hypothetical protein PUN28_013319 [Cardiocondyla obscurior]|uniref:Uncharacterized protein n=1 Tax=Cardiocondyla obscurior TaxID=286306 RepID=A0AAW2FDG5_9HYME
MCVIYSTANEKLRQLCEEHRYSRRSRGICEWSLVSPWVPYEPQDTAVVHPPTTYRSNKAQIREREICISPVFFIATEILIPF